MVLYFVSHNVLNADIENKCGDKYFYSKLKYMEDMSSCRCIVISMLLEVLTFNTSKHEASNFYKIIVKNNNLTFEIKFRKNKNKFNALLNCECDIINQN